MVQVVMCSGVLGDGSLRIVRNGIGMIEQVGSCTKKSLALYQDMSYPLMQPSIW